MLKETDSWLDFDGEIALDKLKPPIRATSSERFIDSGKEEIKIVADILIDNKISIRTFTSAGYKFEKRKENFLRYIKIISN